MAGVSIRLDVADLGAATALVARIATFEPDELMASLGALGESQTRRRISDEKTSPDGAPWAPNRRGGDILVETGQHLLQSIAFTASATETEWGSAWEYAHVHQDGAVIVPKTAKALAVPIPGGGVRLASKVTIPARPFVGLSDENAEEHLELVTDILTGLIR